jgi:hypothetical protein
VADHLIEETGTSTRVSGLAAKDRNIAWFDSKKERMILQIVRDMYGPFSSSTYDEGITIEVADGYNDGPDQRICWSMVIMRTQDKLGADATTAKGAYIRWTSLPERVLNNILASLLTCEYRPWIPNEPKRTTLQLEARGINV